MEEVLAQLAPDMQELLERMSMLEQLCVELCVAILVDNASQEQIQAAFDWLERSNLFLVPLDEHQGWYRFHPPVQAVIAAAFAGAYKYRRAGEAAQEG